MEYLIVGAVCVFLGLGGGGYLGYKYGSRAAAAAKAVAESVKQV